jgi:hypothetical protein
MATTATTEADIWAELVAPDQPDFAPEAARGLLDLKFSKQTLRRIRQLLSKNNRGGLDAEERILLERYLRVGQTLDLLHAKARISLKHVGEVA